MFSSPIFACRRRSASFVVCIVIGAWPAKVVASASARACKAGMSGCSSLTSPIDNAVSASTSLASRIISFTRCGPTSEASRA